MLQTHQYYGDELDQSIQVIQLKESNTPYDFGESHRHNYCEIFFFEKGGGTHEIDFESTPVQNHSVHIVANGKVHLLKREPDSNGFILLFKREILFSAQKNDDFIFLLDNENIQVKPDQFAAFEVQLQQLQQEIQQKDSLHNEIASSILHLIILQLKRIALADSKENRSSNPIYSQFISILEQSFQTQTSATFYTEKLHISGPNLNKILKDISGKTSNEFIQDRRLLEAKRLITHSELNLKEIAFYLNFNDAAHFSHFFKSKTALSPSDFRNSETIYKS